MTGAFKGGAAAVHGRRQCNWRGTAAPGAAAPASARRLHDVIEFPEFHLMRQLLIATALGLGAGLAGHTAMGAGPDGELQAVKSTSPLEQNESAGSEECTRGTSGFVPGSSVSVRRLIGMRVTNPINEQIGEVSDLIVDQCGRIKTVVVYVGGFLGVGGHRVHIGLDKVRVRSPGPATGMVIMVRETRDHILNNRRAPSSGGNHE